jgi:hypothetical protein
MRKKLFPLLMACGLVASPALADFEGTLQMKMSMMTSDGTDVGGGMMNLSVGKGGSRMEMNMQKPMPIKMVVITKADVPDKIFQINDSTRTYSEMDVAKENNSKDNADKNSWSVKKLGEEKILGYNTKHVLVTHGDEKWELWTSNDLIDYATYRKLQASKGRMAGDEGMANALKGANADGTPLKAIVNQGEMKTSIELVKAEKKSLPASTFEVPAGYAKAAAGVPGFGGAAVSDPRADDARKRMDDAIKNMTPEQREMFEKLMKQRQGGNPSQP